MDKVGFFRRLISYIIDWIIVAVLGLIILGIFGLFSFVTADTVVGKIPLTSSHVIGGALAVLWWMLYYVYFWASSGQTPGKMILGIEVLGLFIKHAVLAMRLMANMFAGHLVLAVIITFIAVTAQTTIFLWLPVTIACVIGTMAISLLELFIAFLQAYIFVFLSALFIGMAVHQH